MEIIAFFARILDVMDAKQKKKFRAELERQVASTEEDIERLKGLTKPIAPDNAIGRLTRMEAIQEKSIHEANLRTAEARLKALKRAERLIDRDDFGTCIDCGEEIPFKRLLLVPQTVRCVDCAA